MTDSSSSSDPILDALSFVPEVTAHLADVKRFYDALRETYCQERTHVPEEQKQRLLDFMDIVRLFKLKLEASLDQAEPITYTRLP